VRIIVSLDISQEVAHGQRVRRPPGDPRSESRPSKIPDQQQAEV